MLWPNLAISLITALRTLIKAATIYFVKPYPVICSWFVLFHFTVRSYEVTLAIIMLFLVMSLSSSAYFSHIQHAFLFFSSTLEAMCSSYEIILHLHHLWIVNIWPPLDISSLEFIGITLRLEALKGPCCNILKQCEQG